MCDLEIDRNELILVQDFITTPPNKIKPMSCLLKIGIMYYLSMTVSGEMLFDV